MILPSFKGSVNGLTAQKIPFWCQQHQGFKKISQLKMDAMRRMGAALVAATPAWRERYCATVEFLQAGIWAMGQPVTMRCWQLILMCGNGGIQRFFNAAPSQIQRHLEAACNLTQR